MHCKEILPKLAAYAEGRLASAERDRLETHLQECGDCRTAMARVDWLAALLCDSEIQPAPTGLAGRVISAARERHAKTPPLLWNPAAWWQTAPTAMRAIMVLALVTGSGIGAALGWSSAPAIMATKTAEEAGLLEAYPIDYLGGAPAGSLADSYLTLLAVAQEERP